MDVKDFLEIMVDIIYMLIEIERKLGVRGYQLEKFMEMNLDIRENR